MVLLDNKYKLIHDTNNEKKQLKEYRRKEIINEIKLTSEQKRLIDSLYIENYGKKIDYRWHRYYTSFSGRFDEKYHLRDGSKGPRHAICH